MVATDRMDVQIKAHDHASMILGKIAGKFGTTTKAGLAMGVAMAGVTLAMQAAMQAVQALQQWIGESIKKFREFEKAMAEVGTMLRGLDQELLPSLTTSIEALSLATGKSVTDLARGLYQVLSAGVEASKAIKVLEVATKLAVGTLTDAETAVDALTTVLNAYGLSAEQAAHIADVMDMTIKEGKLRMEELANALGYVVPIAAQAGISFEEVSAAIATLTKQGISCQKATRGLRQVINNLIAPSSEATTAMGKLGVVYDDLILQAIGLEGVMQKINDATGGQVSLVATLIPNVQALSSGLGLIANDGEIFASTADAISTAVGSLDQTYKEMTDTTQFLKDQQEALGDSYDRSMGAMGEEADRTFGNIINNFKALVIHGGNVGQTMADIASRMASAEEASSKLTSTNKVEKYAAGIQYIVTEMNKWKSLTEDMTNRQEIYRHELEKIKEQKEIYVATHKYTEALRYIPIALKDAIYASKIFETSTGNLIRSIVKQTEAIKKLEEISDAYSISQQKNQLEILRIQYAADGRRGRLTRNEKQRIKELQRANNLLRINTLENELVMDEKKKDLSPDEERLEGIKRVYGEELHIITDTYNREVEALGYQIKAKQKLIDEYTGYIELTNGMVEAFATQLNEKLNEIYTDPAWLSTELDNLTTLLEGYIETDKLIVESAAARNRELNALNSGTTNNGTKPLTETIGGAFINMISQTMLRAGLIGKYQSGTDYVPQTGIYQLHKGEAVVPANQNRGGVINLHVEPITVNANITDDTDIETLGSKIGQCLAAGLVKGITSQYQVG